MSVSKLESLPNEILVDILEKYLNGIDILNAFAFQLNRRFDALIMQCQRLRFDFMRCRKDDFRLCMDVFPAYVEKIDELALSVENTPGQINAFLSLYPSFDVFNRLRKVYFRIAVDITESSIIRNAVLSLSNTTVDTLSIKITKPWYTLLSSEFVNRIFGLRKLKKLSIICDPSAMHWDILNTASSNIEHLTFHGLPCTSQGLTHLFRYAPALKYLDIDLDFNSSHSPHQSNTSSKDSITRMLMLHTFMFNTEKLDVTSHTQLEPYLRCMPSLHRLEIKAGTTVVNFSNWETLLQTSSPSLTYFILDCGGLDLTDANVDGVFASIETPFWIEKENFNIIIKEFIRSGVDRDHLILRRRSAQRRFNEPVAECWILPRRNVKDNLHVLNRISNLRLRAESSLLSNHYLDNVTYLVVAQLNDSLFQLITTHVNCSRIKHLDISPIEAGNDQTPLFLQYTRNIRSLEVNLDQLCPERLSYLREYQNIKFLDISASSHSFDEQTIATIASIFPYIEHLTVNTQDLRNVPLLWTYLPHLRSLTGPSTVFDSLLWSLNNFRIGKRPDFLSQPERNEITVWIDRAALEDCFWQSTDRTDGLARRINHAYWRRTTATTTNQSWPRKVLRRVFRSFANGICIN